MGGEVTNVSETAGQLNLIDNVRCKGGHSHVSYNVRCKMHQTRLQVKTRQSEMADLARRATRDLSQFHMGGPNFDTVRSWKL